MKSIKSRLPLLISASVILCIIISVLSMIVISSADRSMMEDKINENKASMQQATSNVQKDITAKCDFIRSMAGAMSGEEAKDFAWVVKHHRKDLAAYAETGGFLRVLLVDPEGNVDGFEDAPVNIADRSYFRVAALGNSGVSSRVSSKIPEASGNVLVYYAPVMDNHNVVAVLIGLTPAEIDMAAYSESTSDAMSGMYILDAKGALVMSSHSDGSSTFYDYVKDSKYADGTSSDYRELETAVASKPSEQETTDATDAAPVLQQKATDYYAGDMTNSKGFFGWLTNHDNTSRIYLKKSLIENGWTLFYVRTVALSDSTVSFIILSRVLLGSIVLIFLIAMIVMLWLQWFSSKRITDLAYRDEVTGHANWQKFKATCNRRLSSKSWWKTNYAAIYIDVNRFTIYNEYYGTKAGDHLLRYISDTLDLMSSAKEMAARREADKFVLMWSFSDVPQLEERLHDFFDLLKDGPNSENVSVTTGVYLMNRDDKDIAAAVDLAGLAEQDVGEVKTNTIAFFDEKLREKIKEEHELESLMRMALANDEFKLYLQPKHRVQDGALAGAEALVRWINPEKGFISPGKFIPLFEKNGFVDDVDNHMLERLCQFQQKRMLLDKRLVPISVNVSRVQLSNPELAQNICKLVDYYRIPHKYIDLELTESACFDDMDVLINTINTLREMGFPVSMDDFGSGYSSLNLLKQLSFDTLKIDGEFFRHITDPDRANTVVKSIIDMAKALNMKTVAEGIETEEQVAFLRTTDCDLIQGYYYSKPISADEFEKYMAKNKIRDF